MRQHQRLATEESIAALLTKEDLRGLGPDEAKLTKEKVNDIRRKYKEWLKQYALLHWNETQGDREPLSQDPEIKARQLRAREVRQQQEVFCGFEPDGGLRTRSGGSRPCAYLSLRTPPAGSGGFGDLLLGFILASQRVDIWGGCSDGACTKCGVHGKLEANEWRLKEAVSAVEPSSSCTEDGSAELAIRSSVASTGTKFSSLDNKYRKTLPGEIQCQFPLASI
ncbi:TPA: hypothetical protein ACH3X2_003769 [Trebouxia sp. C0005]